MTDVYIVGTTLPALAAALELAEVGLSVRVSAEDPTLALAELNQGGELDPEGAIAELLSHLAEPVGEHGISNPGAAPVVRDPRPVQLLNAKGNWILQPTPSVWGIPAVPMATQALSLLGGGAAMRASLDRVKPVLTIGKTHELGTLVRNRMGRAVEERLVDPLVRERYGVAPDSVEVAVAAPGLNEALTRAGSLSGAALAYGERYAARESRVAPSDGWASLLALFVERLRLYGVEFSELPVQAVQADEAAPDTWLVREFDGQEFSARALVVDPAAPLPDTLETTVPALVSDGWRVQARVRVADPELPDPNHPALRTVELAGQAAWTMRLERDSAAQWHAQLAGPRVAGSKRDVDLGTILAEAAAVTSQLTEAVGLRATAEPDVTVVTAPHTSTEGRDAEAARLLAQREREPSILPIGAGLHGGDLAAAIADSRDAAVALRRKLTGIAG